LLSENSRQSIAPSHETPQKTETPPALNPLCQPGRSPDSDSPTICALQQEKDGDVYKLRAASKSAIGPTSCGPTVTTIPTAARPLPQAFTLDGGPNDDHIKANGT
jgi:hypothetical protein